MKTLRTIIFGTVLLVSFILGWKTVRGGNSGFELCDFEALKEYAQNHTINIEVELNNLPVSYVDYIEGLSVCDYWVGTDRSEEKDELNHSYNIYLTIKQSSEASDVDSITFTINVTVRFDITPPVIEGVNDLNVEINSEVDLWEGITITDNKTDQDQIVFWIEDEELKLDQVGEYSITYYARDNDGNTASVTAKVKVIDTTPPNILNPQDYTFEVHQLPEPSYFIDRLDVTDNSIIEGNWKEFVTCNVDLSMVKHDRLGKYPYTVTCHDHYENETTEENYIEIIDSTKPQIIPINDYQRIDYLISSGPIKYEQYIQLLDNYDQLSFDNLIIIDDNVNFNVPGFYYVTFIISDSSGNQGMSTIPLRVYDDDTPEFTKVPELKFQVGSKIDLREGFSVWDKTDGDITESMIVIDRDVNYEKIGTYPIIFIVTDRSGNTNKLELTITLIDDSPPVIKDVKEYIEVAVFDENYDFLQHIQVEDDYDEYPNISIEHNIDFNTVGEYELTYIVKDSSGNTTHQTVTVKIIDNESPVLEPIEDITIKLGESIELLDYIRVSDNYDSYEDLTINIIGTYDVHKEGKYIIKVEITDTNGNKTEQTFHIIVKGNKAPINKGNKGTDGQLQLLSFFGDEKIAYVISFTAGVLLIGIGVRWFQHKKYKKSQSS